MRRTKVSARLRLLAVVSTGAATVALTAVVPAGAADATDTTAGVLLSTSALSSDDVWAAGYAQGDDTTTMPLAEHWDGSAWSIVPVA